MTLRKDRPSTIPTDMSGCQAGMYEFASLYVEDRIVLDVACGTGYGSKILRENGAHFVVGVDLDRKALDNTKAYRDAYVDFIKADGTLLPLRKGIFDIVVSFETIEHIRDYKLFIAECERVLECKGLIIISTPNKRLYSLLSNNPHNPFHVKEFTLEEIVDIIRQNFHVTGIFGTGKTHSLFRHMLEVLLWMFRVAFSIHIRKRIESLVSFLLALNKTKKNACANETLNNALTPITDYSYPRWIPHNFIIVGKHVRNSR